MIRQTIILVSIVFGIIACGNNSSKTETKLIANNYTENNETLKSQKLTKADSIINEAIQAHGGTLYNTANYSFIFRKKEYRFTNNDNQYTYSVKRDQNTNDFIINGTFKRHVNEKPIEISKKNAEKYTEALNSVIYFATLPYKLNDAAVNKKFIETTSIKGINYDVIEVTFNQEGGGKDHEDEFHYWVNQETKKIDYLAYKYNVNKGGVRFRSAYNQRVVDGITFQDYINWKAPVGTPLKELPVLFEQGKLKELSRIDTENVINLKK